jgi:hypothetical protein
MNPDLKAIFVWLAVWVTLPPTLFSVGLSVGSRKRCVASGLGEGNTHQGAFLVSRSPNFSVFSQNTQFPTSNCYYSFIVNSLPLSKSCPRLFINCYNILVINEIQTVHDFDSWTNLGQALDKGTEAVGRHPPNACGSQGLGHHGQIYLNKRNEQDVRRWPLTLHRYPA